MADYKLDKAELCRRKKKIMPNVMFALDLCHDNLEKGYPMLMCTYQKEVIERRAKFLKERCQGLWPQ